MSEMVEVSNPVESSIARLACLEPAAAPFLPDFLVVSAPKTGSTWLASNLRCHPEIFIPAIKEVKYFSTYYQWLDLNWYAKHFQPGGERLKGEASPSYSVLPRRMIQLMRTLMPKLRLIFLIRDPVGRAWSHAKHNWQYREANFRAHEGAIDTVADREWQENFRHPWALASGDYLGQLSRWLSVFPRQQVFVDLYERIQCDPVGLLTEIMAFLGVNAPEDWSTFPTREIVLSGPPMKLSSALEADLRCIHQQRTQELVAFLHEQFGLSVGVQWHTTLGGEEKAPCASSGLTTCSPSRLDEAAHSTDEEVDLFNGFSDQRLEWLLRENDSGSPRVMEEGFHGYQIVLHRGRFFAVAIGLGEVDLDNVDEAASRAHGDILVADSLERAKEVVMHHVIADLRCELASAHGDRRRLESQLAEHAQRLSSLGRSLEAQRQELAGQIGECQAFMSRMRNSTLFRVRRRLARLLAKKVHSEPTAN
jgi:hypothetical protein